MIPGEEPRTALPPLLVSRWLLLGVGNELRGDDGFGPRLARRLAALGLPALDGGTAPENAAGPIGRTAPDLLLVADAAGLGAPEGTLRLLAEEDLAEGGTSTHDPSLGLLLAYLRARRPMQVRVLAAQATRRGVGESMSPALEAALEETVALFVRGA